MHLLGLIRHKYHSMLGAQTSGTLTIGNSSSRTGDVVIANTTRGDIYLGNAMNAGTNIIRIGTANRGTLSLRGANVTIGEVSGTTVEIFKPYTPQYNPSLITSTTIGYSVPPTYNTPFNLSPSVVKNIATYSLPIGVYFIQASIQTPTPVTYQGLGISLASATIEYECWSHILTDNYIWFALCVLGMVVITTASTPYYVIAQAGDTRTLLQVRTQCFRIA